MKKSFPYAILVIADLGLAGCPKSGVTPSDTGDGAGAETRGTDTGTDLRGAELSAAEMKALRSKKRVYFALDSSAVDQGSRNIIKAHAAYLADNPRIKVTLEGHCDERGTREYNLALGERRAQSVSRLMTALGISSRRTTNTSYGEEKPVALGHNESAWRLNRRVEIIY